MLLKENANESAMEACGIEFDRNEGSLREKYYLQLSIDFRVKA